MILRLEEVNKNYGEERITIKILKNVRYEFKSGNIYTITGPKYTGKTVLMNLIGGLELPTSGYITIDNVSYVCNNDKEDAKTRKEYFGYVLPYLELNPNKSIIDNIKEPLLKKDKNINEILKLVDLNIKRKLTVDNLSEIDRIRIYLARALINNPKIILIDEMLEELSTNNKLKIMKILRNIANQDKLVIITSNSNSIIDNSDKVINLVVGRIK